MNVYVAQKCPELVDLQRSFDTRYVENKAQRRRFMKLYDPVRDLPSTDELKTTSIYYIEVSSTGMLNDLDKTY